MDQDSSLKYYYLEWILEWNGRYFLYGIAIENAQHLTLYMHTALVATGVPTA